MKKRDESVEREIQKLDREIAEYNRIRDFRFDDAAAAELSKILGEEVFQTIREELETAANYLKSGRVSKHDRLKRRRAILRLPRLVSGLINTVEQIYIELASFVEGFDLRPTLDGLRQLEAHATELATFKPSFRSSTGGTLSLLVALNPGDHFS